METEDRNIDNNFAELEQECLYTSTSVHAKYLLEKEYKTYVNFTWNVQAYSTLTNYVIYCKTIATEDYKWAFQLVKTKEKLFLFLSSKEVPNISVTFYLVSSNPNVQSQCKDCIEISEGLYVSEFCSGIIHDTNHELLVKDVLKIHCRYMTRPVEHYHRTVPFGQLSIKSDSHDLCEDFRTLYFNKMLHPDFALLSADGQPFFVHKLVLCARSELFKDIFAEDDAFNFIRKRFRIEAHSCIVECIVVYMYCGELKDLPLENMIEVFNMAAVFRIPSLVKRCVDILKERLSEENAYVFLEIAAVCKVVDMKNEIIRFFTRLRGKIDIEVYEYIRKLEIYFEEIRAINKLQRNLKVPNSHRNTQRK